jgi:hypothetical protein
MRTHLQAIATGAGDPKGSTDGAAIESVDVATRME